MRHRTKWGKNRNEGLSTGSVSDKDRRKKLKSVTKWEAMLHLAISV